MHKTLPFSVKTTNGPLQARWKQITLDDQTAPGSDDRDSAQTGPTGCLLWWLWPLLNLGRGSTTPPPGQSPPSRTPGTLTLAQLDGTPPRVVPATFEQLSPEVTMIRGRLVEDFFMFTCELILKGDEIFGRVYWSYLDQGGQDDGTEGYVEQEGSGGG